MFLIGADADCRNRMQNDFNANHTLNIFFGFEFLRLVHGMIHAEAEIFFTPRAAIPC